MPDPDLLLTTQDGPVPGPVTRETLRAAIQGAHEEGGFVALQRGDGYFLQYDGAHLELGGDDRIRRADLDSEAARLFGAFLDGESIDEALPWKDVSDEVFSRIDAQTRARRGLWILMALLVGAAAAVYFLLSNARG